MKKKSARVSDGLKLVQFKYFTLPDHLKKIVDEEGEKLGVDGPTWLEDFGMRLQEKGVTREQVEKVLMSKAPTVTGGNHKSLIEFVNGFLGPTKIEAPGAAANQHMPKLISALQTQGQGNTNYLFSGIELQPLKNKARIGEISEKDLLDLDSNISNVSLHQMDEESAVLHEKLKHPPNFTEEQVRSIQSRFRQTHFFHLHNSLENSDLPLSEEQVVPSALDAPKDLSLTAGYCLYLAVEQLVIVVLLNGALTHTNSLSDTLNEYLNPVRTLAACLMILTFFHVYRWIENLGLLWTIIALLLRFLSRLCIASLLLMLVEKLAPSVLGRIGTTLWFWPVLALWRGCICGLQHMLSAYALQARSSIKSAGNLKQRTVVFLLYRIQNSAVSTWILVTLASAFICIQDSKSAASVGAIPAQIRYLIIVLTILLGGLELELDINLIPQVVEDESTKDCLTIIHAVQQQKLARLLVAPHLVRQCRLKDKTYYKQLYPHAILR